MKKVVYVALTAIGLLGIIFILYTVIGFTPHDYFFIQYPDIKKYVGINVDLLMQPLAFLPIIP